jgi:hypothetical protein
MHPLGLWAHLKARKTRIQAMKIQAINEPYSFQVDRNVDLKKGRKHFLRPKRFHIVARRHLAFF